jgi:hypothetical protein
MVSHQVGQVGQKRPPPPGSFTCIDFNPTYLELGAVILMSTFFSVPPRKPPLQTTSANNPTIIISAIAQIALLAALFPSSAINKFPPNKSSIGIKTCNPNTIAASGLYFNLLGNQDCGQNRNVFGRIGTAKYKSFYFFHETTIITLVTGRTFAAKRFSPKS